MPQTLIKDGYTFHGYYEKPNGKGLLFYAPSSDPNYPELRSCVPVSPWNRRGNGTIYAYFTKNPSQPIVVTFNAQGGTVSPTSKVVEEGKAYGDLPEPQYRGWGFYGWTFTPNNLDMVTKDTIVTKTASHSIHAYWLNGKTYSITYHTNGGTINSGKVTSYTFHYGATLPTDVTMLGHSFCGWYDDISLVGTPVTAIAKTEYGDRTFYAKWSALTFTVTFNANGGTVSPSTMTATYGQQYGELPTPVRTGYVFNDWYDGESKVSTSTTYRKTVATTLIAHWTQEEPEPTPTPITIIKYKIKLMTDGGTVAESYGELKYVMGVAKTLPTADEVTKEGYTFGGWYLKSNFSGEPQTVIPATAKNTKTYYARWV